MEDSSVEAGGGGVEGGGVQMALQTLEVNTASTDYPGTVTLWGTFFFDLFFCICQFSRKNVHYFNSQNKTKK